MSIASDKTQPSRLHSEAQARRESPRPSADGNASTPVDQYARDEIAWLQSALLGFMGRVDGRLDEGSKWMHDHTLKFGALESKVGGVLGKRERVNTLLLGIIAGVMLTFLAMRVLHEDERRAVRQAGITSHASAQEHAP
jgi:hypothetical protein